MSIKGTYIFRGNSNMEVRVDSDGEPVPSLAERLVKVIRKVRGDGTTSYSKSSSLWSLPPFLGSPALRKQLYNDSQGKKR